MKTKVLPALMACCALYPSITGFAQPQAGSIPDTLIILLPDRGKVFFIGNDLALMAKYRKADSIKDYFLSDLEKARQQPGFPVDAKLTHYFVHANGKRKLKTQTQDFQEPVIDVEGEIRTMRLDLPPYAYHLHDVTTGYEIHVFLADPVQIARLREVSLIAAITDAAADKRALRKHHTVVVQHDQGIWRRTAARGRSAQSLELHVSAGGAAFGSQLSPESGVELAYIFSDKHAVPFVRLGLSSRQYLFSRYADRWFSDFYSVSTVNVNVMIFVDGDQPPSLRWAGVEAGFAHGPDGFLHKNFKLGVVFGFQAFQVGCDFYERRLSFATPNSNPMFAVTARAMF